MAANTKNVEYEKKMYERNKKFSFIRRMVENKFIYITFCFTNYIKNIHNCQFSINILIMSL